MTSNLTTDCLTISSDSGLRARRTSQRGGRAFLARAARMAPVLGIALMAAVGSGGCLGSPDEEGQVEASEQGLARGGGSVGNSYSCTNGTCTCDKSIENDCENMSGVCTDATVDGLINCINGWLTTHCTCKQALVAPPKPRFPIGGVGTIGTLSTAR